MQLFLSRDDYCIIVYEVGLAPHPVNTPVTHYYVISGPFLLGCGSSVIRYLHILDGWGHGGTSVFLSVKGLASKKEGVGGNSGQK